MRQRQTSRKSGRCRVRSKVMKSQKNFDQVWHVIIFTVVIIIETKRAGNSYPYGRSTLIDWASALASITIFRPTNVFFLHQVIRHSAICNIEHWVHSITHPPLAPSAATRSHTTKSPPSSFTLENHHITDTMFPPSQKSSWEAIRLTQQDHHTTHGFSSSEGYHHCSTSQHHQNHIPSCLS